ncbi:MAG: YfhO family protein [Hyphomicrobiaceae bacterium]|nr:YfhO family protein [Hyphomicrobiaceae bacterium]
MTARFADVDCRHGGLLAGGLTTCVWLLALARWVWTDLTVPWDAKNQFYAFFRFLATSLHAGTSPFWNPYHFGGHPGIADPQSLIFSPAFVLWAWLDSAPSMLTFDVIVFVHLLAGGLGVVAIGRRRHWPVSACVLAACVFMLGGPASGRLNHTGIILCYGLFPLAALLLEIALQERSRRAALAFGLIAAQIVIARNQVALLLCLALLVLGAREVLRVAEPWTFLRDRLGLFAAMAAVVAALSLVPLVLTLQLASLSNRPAVTLAEALQASVHPSVLLNLAVPNVFGSHLPDFAYWGPGHHTVPEVAATDDSFNYVFVGAVPILILLWLGVARRRLVESGLRTWTLILAGALLFSLGRYTPVFGVVFEQVPGFVFFRRPIDGLFVVGAMVALISGQLVSDYVQGGRATAARLGTTTVVFVCLTVVASAIGVGQRSDRLGSMSYEIAKSIPILAGATLLLWRAHGEARRTFAAACVTLLAVGELVFWNTATRLNGERHAYYRVLEQASAEDQEAIGQLAQELARRRAEGARPRVEIIGLGGAWQNLAVVQGFEATNGYNPLRVGAYDRLIQPGESSAFSANRRFTRTFSGYDCALARAIGLEYLVLDRPIEKLGQLARRPKVEMLRDGPSIWIYRLANTLPRVKFHSRVVVADTDETDISGNLVHPPEADRAHVDEDTPLSARFRYLAGNGGEGQARILSWRPGRIEIAVTATAPGVLVLHDTYYPGWSAEIDGIEVPILKADTLFRAVEVEAGTHTVVFRYRPLRLSNLIGALVGAASGR